MNEPLYVALEGTEWVGKSTQLDIFTKSHPDWLATKEPCATDLGKIIEPAIRSREISDEVRYQLLLADRLHAHTEIIHPAIAKKRNIITDRSLISGIVYHLADTGKDTMVALHLELGRQLETTNGITPNRVVLLTHGSQEQLQDRMASRDELDGIEAKGLDYLMHIQELMISVCDFLLEQLGVKYDIIDANLPPDEIAEKIERSISM